MPVNVRSKHQLFRPGDMVRYVPTHAFGDIEHPDCEDGMITSQTENFVFVRYVFNYVKGGEKYSGRWRTFANGEACKPEDLVLICRPK